MYFIICIKHLLGMKHNTILGTGDIPVNEIDMVPGFKELTSYLGQVSEEVTIYFLTIINTVKKMNRLM